MASTEISAAAACRARPHADAQERLNSDLASTPHRRVLSLKPICLWEVQATGNGDAFAAQMCRERASQLAADLDFAAFGKTQGR